jgi:hypothetical protein
VKTLRQTSSQGIGGIIHEVNQLRADELLRNIGGQDINLEGALRELQSVRDFVSKPEHIQGSINTKHGKIAEVAEVGINNAQNRVVGKSPEYTLEADPASHIDYYKNGNPIQSKFVQTNLSVDAINKHLLENPNFLSGQGGSYNIPRDHFEKIQEWRKLSPSDLNNLPSSEGGDVARRVIKKITDFEQTNNVKFEDVVRPSQTTYDEVQLGKVSDTIDNKEQELIEVDEAERQKYKLQAKASLKEGLKVAGIAAAIDGVLSFGATVVSKLKQGKKLSEFTDDDWKEIFKETGIGVVRGGVIGGSIYTLTNVAGMSAPLAAGLVTATLGVVKQAIQLGKGNISTDDFLYNISQLATDAAVSGAGAAVGQMLIPVPVVGAVIGSLVATKVLGFMRDNFCAGSYYDLVNKAKYQNELTSVYRILTDSLEQSRQTFENMVRTFAFESSQIEQHRQKAIINQSKLNDLLESIR